MEALWRNVNISQNSEKVNIYLFLLLNTVMHSILGFLVWFIIRFFALKSTAWAICFMGYLGFFCGLIGGILFLWRRD